MFRSMANKKGKRAMLSPKAFAEIHGVAYTTVMFWLKNELIKGVEREPLPFGKNRFVYQIPVDAVKPDLRPGPKPKTDDDGQADASPTIEVAALAKSKKAGKNSGKK